MQKLCETDRFEIFEDCKAIVLKKKDEALSLKVASSSMGLELMTPDGKIVNHPLDVQTQTKDIALVVRR